MNRACPICLSNNKKQLYKQNFGNQTIAPMIGYNIVICQECGFAYADNIPSQEKFDDYYTEMSKYEFSHSDGIVAEKYVNHFQNIVDFLIPYLANKKSKIIDIGCSTGCLLSLLKSEGYCDLTGLDPSQACVKTAKELYNIDIINGSISDLNDSKKYDLVILSAVLEHLVDFEGSLNKICSSLNHNGLIFIEVPDALRFSSYITAPFQQFSIEHINYFSKYSIANLLSKYSFELLNVLENVNLTNELSDPDIFVMAKKVDNSSFKIERDNVSEINLKEYIKASTEIDLKIKKIIKEKLIDKEKIIIWGVGTHTQRLIGSGLDLKQVAYFVDSNERYCGKEMNGVKIKSPNDINEDVPILISSYSYQDEISKQIRDDLKLDNEILKLY
ncbi:MAG: class I SAM-dependent methyltransferase [bacterium]